MKACKAFAVWLALAAGTATAAPIAVGELMQILGAVESSSARFVETRSSALLKSPLVLKGTLSYRRPDRIEKHVLAPHEERVIVEGGRLTLESGAKKSRKTVSVSSAPGLAALVESIRATRAGDLPALQRHYAVHVDGSREEWSLTLRPLDARVAEFVISIAFTGSGPRINRIVIEEAGGDRSVMEIEEQGERAPSGEGARGLPVPPAPPVAR